MLKSWIVVPYALLYLCFKLRLLGLRKSQQFFFLLIMSTNHTQNHAVFRILQTAIRLNVFITKASKPLSCNITCHVCLHPKPQQIHWPRCAVSVPSPSGQESNLLRSQGSVFPDGWSTEWESCCTPRPFQQSRLIWLRESDLKFKAMKTIG